MEYAKKNAMKLEQIFSKPNPKDRKTKIICTLG